MGDDANASIPWTIISFPPPPILRLGRGQGGTGWGYLHTLFAEEDWSEAQGSQGSYLARALRTSEGWCCLRLDRGEKPCMVSDPLAESGRQQRHNFFRGESV